MSKRGGESTRNQKVKKRKGIKIRTTVIPDSDEEGLPVNVNTDYARLVQTRVTASGKVGSITTSSVPLLEGEEATEDFSSEADIIRASDPVVDGIVTVVQKARKKRKKANDSVSFTEWTYSQALLTALQTKMWSWLDVRSTVLDEIISLDGPGDIQTNLCSSCSNPESIPLYRCLECSYGLLFCGGCVIKLHQVLPLHRLEVCYFPRSLALSHRDHICSAGRAGFSTGLLYTPLDSSAILGTGALLALSTQNLTMSSSLTSTVGTNCESNSVPVGQAPHGTNAIVNYYECAGIRHPSIVLEPRSPSTFSIHTTK